MSFSRAHTNRAGFSLLELLVTIAIIAVLAALLAPTLSKSMGKAKQISCVSKLRQVGLAMHSFAQDHSGNFPWQIPTLRGGSMYELRFQLKASPLLSYSGRHFEVLSNDLVTPKIIVCPADKKSAADTFTKLQTTNLSYWVFYRASLNDPTHPLSGDINVQSVGTNRSKMPGRTNLLTIRFDPTVHQLKGNILFADGHVELVKNADLPDLTPSGPGTGFNSVRGTASTVTPGGSTPTLPPPPALPPGAPPRRDAGGEKLSESPPPSRTTQQITAIGPAPPAGAEPPAPEKSATRQSPSDLREKSFTIVPLEANRAGANSVAGGTPTQRVEPAAGVGNTVEAGQPGKPRPEEESEPGREFNLAWTEKLAQGGIFLQAVLLALFLGWLYVRRKQRATPGVPVE